MGLMYVLATLLVVGICSADQMVNVDEKTYALVMVNGMVNISKQKEISKDMNKIVFALKNVMTTNGSMNFDEADMMNFTLVPSAAQTEQLALNRVVGTMMVNGITLTMHVDVFTAGGNVTMDGETTVMMEGDMMITLMVSGTWTEGSTMLKLKFMIEGSKTPMSTDSAMTDGSAYELGGDGMVILSKKANIGEDVVDTMPMVAADMVTVSFNKSAQGSPAYTYKFFIKPATAKVDTSSSARVTSLGALTLALIALTAMLW